MSVKVKLLKDGKAKKVLLECPQCGRYNWAISDEDSGVVQCWHCHAVLEWSENTGKEVK